MIAPENKLLAFHHLRVRVSGILIKEQKVLLINHNNMTPSGNFWAPPGGGLEYGESIDGALKREFIEETHLKIKIKEFVYLNEHLQMPLHAIELFYTVDAHNQNYALGFDPELNDENQIIKDIKFFSKSDLKELGGDIHPILEKKELLGLL